MCLFYVYLPITTAATQGKGMAVPTALEAVPDTQYVLASSCQM